MAAFGNGTRMNRGDMATYAMDWMQSVLGELQELRRLQSATLLEIKSRPERRVLSAGDQFAAAAGLIRIQVPPAVKVILRRFSITTTAAAPGCVADLYENNVAQGNFLERLSPGSVGSANSLGELTVSGGALLIFSLSAMTPPCGVQVRIEADVYPDLGQGAAV
jgi:hypothetical protein